MRLVGGRCQTRMKRYIRTRQESVVIDICLSENIRYYVDAFPRSVGKATYDASS